MANTTFQLRRSSVSGKAPNTSTISIGELALNLTDRKLYSTDGTTVFETGANLTSLAVANATVTGLTANSSAFVINTVTTHTNSININNNLNLNFQTVNASAYVGMRQQNDDNFVFYSTNTSGGSRAVWSIYANSITSSFSLSVPALFNTNTTFSGPIILGGSNGAVGQVLTSNGTSAPYWSTVSGGGGSVNVAAQYTWTNTQTFQNTITFSSNILVGTTVNATSYNTGGGYGSATGGFIANSTVIAIGNSTVNVTINSTSSTATANNSLYLGGTIASSFVANTGLFQNTSGHFVNTAYIATLAANAATYLNGKTEGNLNVNNSVTSNTANTATYIVANTGIVSNATGVYVNAAYINTISANAATYLNGKTEGNLNVNSATTATTSNNSTYAFGKTEGNLNANSALTANNASYLGGTAAASYVQNTDSRTLSGNLNFTGVNTYFSAPVTFATNTLTIGTSAYFASNGNIGFGTTNPTTLLDVGSRFQVVSGVGINVNGSIEGGTAASGNQLSFNFQNSTKAIDFQAGKVSFSGNGNVGINNTSPVDKLSVNGTTYLGGTTNINGTINAASHTIGTTWVANTSGVYMSMPLTANGGTGTAGQVLTSNGATGSPYWANTASGGSTGYYAKGGATTIGSASDANNIFRVNGQTLYNNTTIGATENAQCAGPLTVQTGITLTVTTGARVVIS